MVRCCVPQCNSYDEKVYEFPENTALCQLWIEMILAQHKECKHAIGWKMTSESRVCARHFTRSDFSTLKLGDAEVLTHQLNPDAIPSKLVNCRKIRKCKVLASTYNGDIFDYLVDDPIPATPPESAEEFIFETGDNLITVNTQLKNENNKMADEHTKFKNMLDSAFIDRKNITDDSILCALTGVASNKEFDCLLWKVVGHVELEYDVNLGKETQMMLVLIKMKMNIPDDLLSLVYSVSMDVLHKIYIAWMKAFLKVAEAMIQWKLSTATCVNRDNPSLSLLWYLLADFVEIAQIEEYSRTSRSSWKNARKSEPDTGSEKVLCLFRPSGAVFYISEILPGDCTLLSALRQVKGLSEFTDQHKIYFVSTRQVVLKKDIELGVMLDNDDFQTAVLVNPLFRASLNKVETVLESLRAFTIFTSGFDAPFTEYKGSLVRICTTVVNGGFEIPNRSGGQAMNRRI
ncbi:unnamed protein product [Clavelina lepadiformis]|uniref:THAP-type domain-containing protein n=1 Tax=Clavelina lepadiformis TaxID=159417 RepID=A0ABP0G4E6_CLALP